MDLTTKIACSIRLKLFNKLCSGYGTSAIQIHFINLIWNMIFVILIHDFKYTGDIDVLPCV